MEAATPAHPTDTTLRAYGLGDLDDSLVQKIEAHLATCPNCRDRLAGVSSDSFLTRLRESQKAEGRSTVGSSLLDDITRLNAAPSPTPPPLADALPPGLADHPDYEIKRELGRGGMGVVYLAHHALTGRDEVLKVVGRQILERPGVLDRFLREIRAVARLRHPNIVAAHSAVRLGENIVLVMEYVEGLDLSRLVKARGPLPVAHACQFAYQAALGLQHAHEEGLVHRDIKPANLMLTRHGGKATVKVLDFGLAKVTREEKVDGGLTSQGHSLGTPDFIAPEQILDARSADIRADIYSLGGTLYYLLAGRPPFEASSLYDIYQAHISRDAERLNLLRPEVSSELAALVAKMMAKAPADRFQTPGEVAEALQPFFRKRKPTAEAATPGVPRLGQETPVRSVTSAQTGVGSAPAETPLIESTRDESRAGDASNLRTPAVEGRAPRGRRPVLVGTAAASVIAVLFGISVVFTRDRDGWSLVVRNTSEEARVARKARPTDDPRPLASKATDPAPAPAPATVSRVPVADTSVAAGREVAVTPEKSPPAAPFDLTNCELFDTGTSKWSVEGDELVFRYGMSAPDRAALLFGSLDWEDYDFVYKTKKVIEKNRVGDGEFKAAFVTIVRSLSPHDQYEYTAWSIGYYPHKFTAVSIANGEGEPLGVQKTKTIKLLEEAWYKVRAEVRGDRIRIFISNDRGPEALMYDVKDGRYPRGRVGIKAVWGIQHFKDIKVTAADGTVLWDGLPRVPTQDAPAPTPGAGAGGETVKPGAAATPPATVNAPTSPDRRDETPARSIGMKLALIPAGEFLMGSTPEEYPQRPNPAESPKHRVGISRPFLIGTTEVTQGQYRAVVGADPSHFKGRDDYPVENVTWLAAVKFCNDLSVREGLPPFYEIRDQQVSVPDPKGLGYRLPTEAEWEYACRAGSDSIFAFGNDDATLADHAWHGANANRRTHAVGGLKPNRFGLFDMHGNVQEWCWDVYAPYSPRPVIDPTGPPHVNDADRVYRNGAFDDIPFYLKSSYRGAGKPASADKTIGFRVARNSPEGAAGKGASNPPAMPPGSVAMNDKAVAPEPKAVARVSKAPPDSPEGRLNAKGLWRSGIYFVVAGEDEALEKFETVRPLVTKMARAFDLVEQALNREAVLADAEATYAQLKAQADNASAVLSKMPNGARANSLEKQDYQTALSYRDSLVQARDEASAQVDAIRGRQVSAAQKAAFSTDFSARRAEYLKAAAEFRPLYDKVKAEYEKRQGDPAVKKDMIDYRRITKTEATLGPSRTLAKAIELIRHAERTFTPGSVAPRKKTQGVKR